MGGALSEDGSITPALSAVISLTKSHPHPPLTIVTNRMTPLHHRRREEDTAYVSVRSLPSDAMEKLISRLLKDRSITASREELSSLVQIADGHPYNVYAMITEIVSKGLESFLANPREFQNWKHKQYGHYVEGTVFEPDELAVLAILCRLPMMDLSSISTAVDRTPSSVVETLDRLIELHVVEVFAGLFLISPPLRIAMERDNRVRQALEKGRGQIGSLAKSLAVRVSEDEAPIGLIDTAVLAMLQSDSLDDRIGSAFLLPSHHVRMAQTTYDRRAWRRAIDHAKRGLEGKARLSHPGLVACCRYLCLAAARLGDDEAFDVGMRDLLAHATSDLARSNISFLRGFRARLRGLLPEAEEEFRKAQKYSPRNTSAARELAAVCLIRNNLEEAEKFAREAHRNAPKNPYLVDILLSVLLRRRRALAAQDREVQSLFDDLEQIGEEDGRSFFTTRKAEYEYLNDKLPSALKLVDSAINKTPTIFEPYKIKARILLRLGDIVKAKEAIDRMKEIVSHNDQDERRSYYREYIVTLVDYLIATGQFGEARKSITDDGVFSTEERLEQLKGIDLSEADFRRKR